MKRVRVFFGKSVAVLMITCLLLVPFAGCASSDDEIVVITERFYFLQMTEITMNLNEFVGRTIQTEGLFREINGLTRDFYVVLRYVVCCENKPFWFELDLNGFEPLQDDAWAKVIGTLAIQNGLPVLVVTSLTELEEHGAAFVS